MVTLVAVVALLALLAVTGVWLALWYRPDGVAIRGPAQWPARVRRLHREASHLTVGASALLAFFAFQLARVRASPGRLRLRLLPLAAFALLAAGSFTGWLLPWDQIALREVTVGGDLAGYRPFLHGGGSVEFVLLGSREVEVSTVARWFWLHAAALPLLLMAALTATALASRRPRAPQGGFGGAAPPMRWAGSRGAKTSS